MATRNEKVQILIKARDEATANLKAKPLALLAYDCGGRRSKLTNLGDEREAIQQGIDCWRRSQRHGQ